MYKRVAFALVLLLTVGLAMMGVRAWRGSSEAYVAEIIHGGYVHRVCLREDRVFTLPGVYHVTFEVRDGRIAFIASDCPDRVCIHAGFLSRPGQAAACLPNRLLLTLRYVDTP